MISLGLGGKPMSIRRTTVALDEGIYRQVKQAALTQDRSIREIVQEALRLFCEGRFLPSRVARRPRFGAYRFRIKGALRRADIYEDRS